MESLENRDLMAGMGLLVPAYIYPEAGGAWDRMAQAATQVPVTAIMNPNSGPGSPLDAYYASTVTDYNAATDKLHAAGGKVIGYVASNYGQRPLDAVKADIDAYRDRFRVDGIFVDEMTATDTPQNLAYYKQIYDYVDGVRPAWTVVGNPGTSTPETYVTNKVADTLVMFEKEAGYAQYAPPAWQGKYPAGNFANLALNIPTAVAMQAAVTQAASQHTGWMFVTNDNTGTGDEWDTLPSYWNQLVSAVASRTVTPNQPLAITGSLPQATVNAAYSSTLTATGGTGAKTFAISAGSLPAGLTLNPTTGLIGGKPTTAGTYGFTVKATDSVGTFASKAFTIAINPAAPVAPVAPSFTVTAVSGSQINLAWTDVSNEAGYRVYRWTGAAWQVIATLGTNVTAFSNTGLTAGAKYFYYVEAFNGAGSASGAWKSVATWSPPAAPASFTAAAVSTSRINLAWTASADATGYRVYVWTGSGWRLAASLGAGTTSYAATGLSGKTTYYFYVEAFNAIGSSSTGWKTATTR